VLKTSVERLAAASVKLTVTVPAEDVDSAIERTYKELAKKYRFPGFRPGKAPKPILDQQLGREYILGEATEGLVNSTYSKALDLEQLRPIESPELEELETVEAGQEYTYTAEIDVRPELAVTKTEGFEISMPQREATQEEIDGQIEQVRERFATLEPVEDRGVQPDDFVLLSFVGTVDGEPYEGNEVDKYLYEMGRGLMPPEFDTGIVGAKPGDERQVEFPIPDTSSNPDFVGKNATFDITIHEIKSKVLPEVDNDFAANVGGFDSVEDMVADIKSRIDLQKGSEYDRARESRAREELAKYLDGEVPEAMITSRKSQMMRDFFNMLESRGMDVEQYLQMSGVTMDVLEADVKVQAEQSVREELALEALFRAHGLEVGDADIEEELQQIAGASESSVEDARKRWEELGLMPVVREQIMHRKAMLWLLDNLKINEEAAEQETAQASEGTKKAATKKSTSRKKKPAEKAEKAAEEQAEAEKTEE